MVLYSKHFIFLLSNGYNKLECWFLTSIYSRYHTSLLCPFVSYEENRVLWKILDKVENCCSGQTLYLNLTSRRFKALASSKDFLDFINLFSAK